MDLRADQYRRCAIEAQRRAVQVNEPRLREVFDQLAHNWLMLAGQVEWLDRHRHPTPKEKPIWRSDARG